MLLACLSAFCFGTAAVASKRGLRYRDVRAGAAISIPTATLLFVLAAPFFLNTAGFVLAAALVFALVGLFFPAAVTLINFASIERLGPTVSSAMGSSAPLFALVAAALLLGERIPPEAVLASFGVLAGITLLSWSRRGEPRRFGWALALPLAGAMIRGLAQALAKVGLVMWPNPFAASLIGYVVSSGTVSAASGFRLRAREGGKLWFMLTGALNGAAVLLMYCALASAPVSTVAPIVATFPLVTAALSVALREEPLRLRLVAGSALIVAAIAYLVAA